MTLRKLQILGFLLPLLLVLHGPAVAEEEVLGQGEKLHRVQELLDSGALVARWVGQGRVAGDIVELTLENTTDQAIAITLESGTVLVLDDEALATEFQPILLEETVTILVPAQGSFTRMLRGYCLDHELKPPAIGRDFPYRLSPDTSAYTPALEVLKASATYDAETHILPVERQRTVVIKRAIWAALGQMTREKLLEDIYLAAASKNKTLSEREANRIADVIWAEVQRLLSNTPQP